MFIETLIDQARLGDIQWNRESMAMNEMASVKPVILIVDDSKVIRLGARKMLSESCEVLLAEDGEQGWQALQKNPSITLVFTDLNMPNMNGMALLENIRSSEDERIAALPVIILSGAEDGSQEKDSAMAAGATDFMFKPFDSAEINSRVRSYTQFTQKLTDLENKAAYDEVTGLLNYDAFCEHGEKALSFACRHTSELAVCVIEINAFEQYLASYGRKVMDIILAAVAKRLKKQLREEDIAGRLDGAGFALVLPMTGGQHAQMVLARLQQDLQKLVFDIGSERIQLSVNIGYSVWLKSGSGFSDTHKTDFGMLLQQATQAVAESASSKESIVACYVSDITEEKKQALSVATETLGNDVRTEDGLMQALQHVVRGEFEKIAQHDRQCVLDQLNLFMRFVADNSSETS